MIKLLRSGKAFNEAISRIHEISQSASLNSAEARELQMLKWLISEYEDRYCCNASEYHTPAAAESQEFKIAFSRVD